MPRDLLTRMLHGAIAGLNGAAAMTVLRMAAHRLGLIDVMVPQKVEQWARRTTGVEVALVPGAHRVVDQLLHLGYGATWGALFGVLTPRPGPARTLAFGLGLWGFGSLVLFPALRVGRPAWRSRTRENAVNVAAHLLYATVTSFLAEELARQPLHHVKTRNPEAGDVG